MPVAQKVMIWLGICLDVFSKAALLIEIVRLAQEKHWGYFALVLLFFAVSGAVVTVYWLTHYPSGIAERLVTPKPRPTDRSAASWLSGELSLCAQVSQRPSEAAVLHRQSEHSVLALRVASVASFWLSVERAHSSLQEWSVCKSASSDMG